MDKTELSFISDSFALNRHHSQNWWETIYYFKWYKKDFMEKMEFLYFHHFITFIVYRLKNVFTWHAIVFFNKWWFIQMS